MADEKNIQENTGADDRMNDLAMMECPAHHARITVTTCLSRQRHKHSNNPVYGSQAIDTSHCENCPTGKEIMEKYKDMETQKVCKDEKCPNGTTPQSLSKFYKNKNYKDGYDDLCKMCRYRYTKDRKKAKIEAEKKAAVEAALAHKKSNEILKNKVGGGITPSDKPDHANVSAITASADPNHMILDFSQFQNLLPQIKKIAAEQLRTPENQVMYWLKTELCRKKGIPEQGWV